MEVHPKGLVVEVRRGSYGESQHTVWGCAVRENGDVLFEVGDVDRVFPIRSLAKPFIAAELVRSGAADALGMTGVELALVSGSHDGEDRHVAAVRGLLGKIGLADDALACGPAMEGSVVIGPPVRNNCSGKHAGVLVLARYLGCPTEGYVEPEHPIQRYLQTRLRATFGRNETDTPTAIDGCSMPIFGASLRDIAKAYATFGTSHEAAVVRVREAIASEPGYAGGWNGNLDTAIVTASNGLILGKIGAEGLHADALVRSGIGVALKVLDGNSRALPPVLARMLAQFAPGRLPESRLAELAAPNIRNAAGKVIGGARLVSTHGVGRVPMRTSEARR